jgi:uncharacterized protein (UPF0335 family)
MNAQIPMKNTEADAAVSDRVYTITGQELTSFMERIERLEAEARDLAEAKKEVYAELKGRGYCAKTVRKVVSIRKRNRDDVEEENAVLDLYLDAVGYR